MKNTAYLWVMAGQIASTAVFQIVPMLMLPVSGYAVYAAVYLGFAACLAIQLATICDVWARALRRTGSSDELLRTYQAALTSLALAGGAGVATVTFVASGQPLLASAAGIAIATAMYRSGIMYRLVAEGRIRRAGASELAGAAAGATAAVVAVVSDSYAAPTALLCWTVATLVSVVAAGIPPSWNPRETAAWFSGHREEIRLLSIETAIKTIETVGTPYMVGAIGGGLALALHRAASSLTYPVRLILDMLRARIISGSFSASPRTLGVIGAIGAVSGALVAVGLIALDRWGILPAGTIVEAMAPHALAVAAWVSTMSISSFIQFAGRGTFTGRRLIVRRVIHTVIVLGLTASGVVFFGPGAVIWFAALSELVASPLWIPQRADRRALATEVREPAL